MFFNSERHLKQYEAFATAQRPFRTCASAPDKRTFVVKTAAHALTVLHLFKRGRYLIAKHRLTEEPLRAIYERKDTGRSFNGFWKSILPL